MVPSPFIKSATFLLFLGALRQASAHSPHGHGAPGDVGASSPTTLPPKNATTKTMMHNHTEWPSYFTYPHHSSLMLVHIVTMSVAWFFLLPIGVVFNITHSRLSVITQFTFLGLNTIALLFGALYQAQTPNLYEHNVHGSFGWLLTCIVLAQTLMVMLRRYGISAIHRIQNSHARGHYQPVTQEAMHHHQISQPRQPGHYRCSHDSGQGTELESSNSQTSSPLRKFDEDPFRKIEQAHDGDDGESSDGRSSLRGDAAVGGILTHMTSRYSGHIVKAIEIVRNAIDRVILVLGFVAISSGVVVYGGIFRGNHIFNGLAHFIKGGIFFWYGLLTFGRWMGCFSEFGWAWNVRPTPAMVGSRKARVPSAEFVESFVIFFYGSTNVFLEHLAAWGKAWTAQDLEHVSISIMFFGGGLCGMLVESKKIRHLLNTVVMSINDGMYDHDERWAPPKSYPFSLNPFPALVILLLGTMMSSHHQASMLSTMIHKQWGTLFVGFALARGVTYVLTYLSPPTSYLPSRPPSELITSFCLISGGIVFMASNKDTVKAMENYDLDAMFIFTVTMGFTAFMMAYALLVFAIRGLVRTRRSPPVSWARSPNQA